MKKLILLSISLTLLIACASQPPCKNFTLQGDHGKLSATLQTPKGKKNYPLVIILHGFNASKDMYLLKNLSEQLNARGIATLIFDFNGHGASEGSFLDMTTPNELEDARRVYAYAAKLPHVTSISMAGHSLGAMMAAMLAGEIGADKVKTIVLMSPAPKLMETIAQGNAFGIHYDPKNVPEYITLHNGLKVGRAFLTTISAVPFYETSKRYTGPVLVVHSTDDQLAPYPENVEFSKIYENVQLEILHGFDHNFTQDTPAVNKKITDYLVKQLL